MKKLIFSALLLFVGLSASAQGYLTGAITIVARQNASSSIANLYTDPCISAGNCARTSTNYSLATYNVTPSSSEAATYAMLQLNDQRYMAAKNAYSGIVGSNPISTPTTVPISVNKGASAITSSNPLTKPSTVSVASSNINTGKILTAPTVINSEPRPCAFYGLNAYSAAQKRSQGICY
jgi:hypothetical protein